MARKTRWAGRGGAWLGWTILAWAWACAPADDGDDGRARTAAGAFVAADSAILLGAGTVSTAAPEFGATLTPGGSTLYFNRVSVADGSMAILVSRFVEGSWTEPDTAPFSGVHQDIDPFVTPDGRFLYFASNRPLGPGDTTGDFNLWRVERAGRGWSEPMPLGESVNSEASETFSSLDDAGNLYFATDRDGTRRTWRSAPSGEGFGEAALLDFPLNLAEGIGNPLVDPSGTRLYFPARGDRGVDLFTACLSGDLAGEPTSLGAPVNSSFTEFAPGLSGRGHLLFTSQRPGIVGDLEEGARRPGDLYYVELAALDLEACLRE